MDRKIEMSSSTKVAVMTKTAQKAVVVSDVVVVVLYVSSMKRWEISNQCACCERTI